MGSDSPRPKEGAVRDRSRPHWPRPDGARKEGRPSECPHLQPDGRNRSGSDRHCGRQREDQARRPGDRHRRPQSRQRGSPDPPHHEGIGLGPAPRLALPGPAPPRQLPDLPDPDGCGTRHARVLDQGRVHRDPLAQVHGQSQ